MVHIVMLEWQRWMHWMHAWVCKYELIKSECFSSCISCVFYLGKQASSSFPVSQARYVWFAPFFSRNGSKKKKKIKRCITMPPWNLGRMPMAYTSLSAISKLSCCHFSYTRIRIIWRLMVRRMLYGHTSRTISILGLIIFSNTMLQYCWFVVCICLCLHN